MKKEYKVILISLFMIVVDISEEVAVLQQRYMDDLNPTGMEAFQMSEQFSDVAPEQIMDIIEDKFPQYMNDPTDPFAGMEMEGEMAYGGRVGLQAGGMPFYLLWLLIMRAIL